MSGMFSNYASAIDHRARNSNQDNQDDQGQGVQPHEFLADFELFPEADDDDEGPTVEHIQDVDAASERRYNLSRVRSGQHPLAEDPGYDTEEDSSSSSSTPTQPSFLEQVFAQRPQNTSPETPSQKSQKISPAMATTTTSAAAGVSPSSSPRLPSPPPFPEVQIGSKSPSGGDRGKDKMLDDVSKVDEGATRRIRPGTKAEDMASGPPLVPLSQLDSPFQLQEHLKALYHSYTKGSSTSATIPVNRDIAHQLATPPEPVDRHLWLYELCRFLVMKANDLLCAFFSDNPPCSASTCPEMRASEWQYLCAVHDPPKSCCAIDYCCHTLDWAANILTSPKHFPSRLTLGNDAAGGPAASMRHLTNVFRRVYRIFAHGWFQHRGVFWEVEGRSGVYIFFKTVCDVYQLIPEDNYTIPAEAEGLENNMDTPMNTHNPDLSRLSILKKAAKDIQAASSEARDFATGTQTDEEDGQPNASNTTISTGATTRRHKHTPSTGSQVTTIAEGAEEEDVPSAGPPPSQPERRVDPENEDEDLKPLSREKTVTNLAEAGVGGEKKQGTEHVAKKEDLKDENEEDGSGKADSDHVAEEGPGPKSATDPEPLESSVSKMAVSPDQNSTEDVEADERMEEVDLAATGASSG